MLMNNDEVLLTILENIQEKINDMTSIMQHALIEEDEEKFEEKVVYLYDLKEGLSALTKVLSDLQKNMLDDEEKETLYSKDASIMWEAMLNEYEKAKKEKKEKKKKKSKNGKKNKKEKKIKNGEKKEEQKENDKEYEIKGVKKIGDVWIL